MIKKMFLGIKVIKIIHLTGSKRWFNLTTQLIDKSTNQISYKEKMAQTQI